jgi:hypothetical protein
MSGLFTIASAGEESWLRDSWFLMLEAGEGGRIIGVEFLSGLIARTGYNGESPLGKSGVFTPKEPS